MKNLIILLCICATNLAVAQNKGIRDTSTTEQKIYYMYDKIVNQNKSFSAFAVLYSEDPKSSPLGGDCGFIKRNNIVSAFLPVLDTLPKNTISKPIKTQTGWYLFKWTAKRFNSYHLHIIYLRSKPLKKTENNNWVQNMIDHGIDTTNYRHRAVIWDTIAVYNDSLKKFEYKHKPYKKP